MFKFKHLFLRISQDKRNKSNIFHTYITDSDIVSGVAMCQKVGGGGGGGGHTDT